MLQTEIRVGIGIISKEAPQRNSTSPTNHLPKEGKALAFTFISVRHDSLREYSPKNLTRCLHQATTGR